jgi:hypothetical protein
MGYGQLPFDVVDFSVTVEEGVQVKWRDRVIDSGRLTLKLDGSSGSQGFIDYDTGKVNVEFRVRIDAPGLDDLFSILDDIGAERDVTAPFGAVIRSEGNVFDNDHALRLAGKGVLGEHRLFDPSETKLEILAPTH